MPHGNKNRPRAVQIASGLSLVLLLSITAQAQVDCVEPNLIKVSQIHGQVFDPSGVPIPNASVRLSREQETLSTATTSDSGKFTIEADPGRYDLRISARGFDSLHFQVQVRRSSPFAPQHSPIRAILSVAHISCSWATTSNKEFQRELKISRKRYKPDATPQ